MHDSRSFFSSEQKNCNSLNKDLVLRYFLVFFALSKFSGRIRLPGKPNTLSCNLLFFFCPQPVSTCFVIEELVLAQLAVCISYLLSYASLVLSKLHVF